MATIKEIQQLETELSSIFFEEVAKQSAKWSSKAVESVKVQAELDEDFQKAWIRCHLGMKELYQAVTAIAGRGPLAVQLSLQLGPTTRM